MTNTADPIFGLIERHRIAANAWFEAEKATDRLEETAPDAAPRSRAYADAMADAQRAAFIRMVTTPPATVAGAVALLRFVIEADAIGDRLLEFPVDGYRIAGLAILESVADGLESTGQ